MKKRVSAGCAGSLISTAVTADGSRLSPREACSAAAHSELGSVTSPQARPLGE